jgi:competence protein ComEC
MFKNRPALIFCAAFVVGIIIGWEIDLPFQLLGISLLALLILFGILRYLRVAADYSSVILLIVVVLFGAAKITFDSKLEPSNNIAFHASSVEKNVVLTGTISDATEQKGRHFTFVVDPESLYFESSKSEVTGSVQVYLYQDSLPVQLLNSMSYGKKVTLRGSLIELPKQRNPYEFDYRRYLLLHGVYARLNMQYPSDVTVSNSSQNILAANLVYNVRDWVNHVLDRLFTGEEGKLMKGLVLGEREEMSTDVKNAFINAGLMHILAVSGFNVGLVVLILYAGLSFFRLPPLMMVILASICLIYFGFITGAQASVFRAVIMAIIFLSAKLLQRKADLLNTLALAAIFLLVIDSRALFDVGFQLSFMAVAGLAYFYPKVEALTLHLPEYCRTNIILRYLIASVVVTVAATLGTLPLSAFYFQKISIAGLGMNLVAVPLSGIILGLGFAAVAASAFSFWLGSIYAISATYLGTFLLKITEWSGYSPFAYVETHFTIFDAVCFYVFILLLFEVKREKLLSRIVIILLLFGNAYVYADIVTTKSQPFRATFLDVGQGDAMFLEFPDGKNALVDAGPYYPDNDAGARFIIPYLQHRGIKKIDDLIISHPHSDHIGGAPFILQHIAIGRVIDAGSRSNSFIVKNYARLIDSLHVDHYIIKAGDTINISKDIRIYALHPSGFYVPSDTMKKMGYNNQSLVLKVVYGATSLLLEGDAQADVEERMEAIYGGFIHSQVLKVGHHGSKTSSSPQFLQLVNPQLAVMEIGRNNKFQFPHRGTLERLQQRSCAYFRTDEDGAIVMESDGSGWNVINWRP